jgi:uncharacterized repeat protein (TIGR03803 family)
MQQVSGRLFGAFQGRIKMRARLVEARALQTKRTMRTLRILITLASATLLLAATANSQAQYSLLHNFAGWPKDGINPEGSLTLDGSTLYGMTYRGGSSNWGTIFRINTHGSGYTILHSFSSVTNDGGFPRGSLTLDSPAIYGMTSAGGSSGSGVVFQINIDGSGYTNLHSFAGWPNDGSLPYGSLMLDGTNLYGMTSAGGSSNWGTIFRINTHGSGYTILHSFGSGANDGGLPYGSLTLDGTNLYGMTQLGGSSNNGTIFQINIDGSGYTILHSFGSGANDGGFPSGSLTLDSPAIYGMTSAGGSSGGGVAFQINIDGSGYTNLHSFGSGGNDGSLPSGSLTLDGTNLYGMTQLGGSSGGGVAFQINIDGSGYTILHSFGSGANDGSLPSGSLTLDRTNLYGTTVLGGMDDDGTVFKLASAEVCTYTLSPTNIPAAANGGSKHVGVKVKGLDCSWTASTAYDWITIRSGGSGTNNSSVVIAVATNLDTLARTGTVSIADQTVTVAQRAAKCSFTLDTNAVTFTSSGGSSDVVVTANGGNCAWRVVNKAEFLTITSATEFTGDGTVTYIVETNTIAKARTGAVTIAGKAYKVKQEAAP